jgi:hypothetical protein
MREITGTDEVQGSGDNPIIMAWPRAIAERFPEMAAYCRAYTHDEIPWCGLTVAYAMAMAGVRPVFLDVDVERFLWAQAWKLFGRAVARGDEQLGDVLVFARHVTLYDGDADDGHYWGLGGNQGDTVKRSRYAKGDCQAIRRAPSSGVIIAPAPANSRRMVHIVATVFGGEDDPQTSAYTGKRIPFDALGCSLPYRFPAPRPPVRVTNPLNGKSIVLPLVDVGPWNTDDPYFLNGARPQAETGTDRHGRRTNLAGIDLTPAAARALGIDGKGFVDFELVTKETTVDDEDTKTNPVPAVPTATRQFDVAAFFRYITDHRDEAKDVLRFALGMFNALHPGSAIKIPGMTSPAPADGTAPGKPVSKLGFGTGILGTILAAIGWQQGLIAAPVGDTASLPGLLSFVLPAALSVFGAMGGPAGILAKVAKGVIGMLPKA